MEGKMKDHKTSLVGFFLGLFAVITGAFGVTTWFLTEASAITTLMLLNVITVFGIVTSPFHVWNKTSSKPNTDYRIIAVISSARDKLRSLYRLDWPRVGMPTSPYSATAERQRA